MTFGAREYQRHATGTSRALARTSRSRHRPGAVTAVVGGDGAGKSTLLRCLRRQRRPGPRATSRARPSSTSASCPRRSGTWRELTVDENIAFVAGVYGLRGRELAQRRDELLGPAGLDPRRAAGCPASSRAACGRSSASCWPWCTVPSSLVLDEPSTGVDPVSRVELWRMIAQAAAAGTAVVMATTYLDEAERASTVLVLDEGRAVLSGDPDQVIDSVRRPGGPRARADATGSGRGAAGGSSTSGSRPVADGRRADPARPGRRDHRRAAGPAERAMTASRWRTSSA